MRQKECLEIKNTERGERRAKLLLQTCLNRNLLAIKSLRSYTQFRESGTNIGHDQMMELEQFIKKKSGNRWECFNGMFCTISDTDEVFTQDNGQFLGIGSKEDVKVIKGFYFRTNLIGCNFECIDLDFGLSRRYYDQKSPAEQEKFMRRFAERQKGSDVFPEEYFYPLPLGFTAFISDQGNKFTIERMVSYQDTSRATAFVKHPF